MTIPANYFHERSGRIYDGVITVLFHSSGSAIGMLTLILSFVYAALLVLGIYKYKQRFAKSLLIATASSLGSWFLTAESTLQAFDQSEGWHRGLSIGFGFMGGIIFSFLTFLIAYLISHFLIFKKWNHNGVFAGVSIFLFLLIYTLYFLLMRHGYYEYQAMYHTY